MSGQSRREKILAMLEEFPDDAELLYALAMEYLSEGDESGAERRFRELIQAAPDYPPGYLQLGQLLVRLGREDEARAVYRDGIAVARKKGDEHAAGEMSNFLLMLG